MKKLLLVLIQPMNLLIRLIVKRIKTLKNGKGHKYSDQDESRREDSQRRKELWERYKERMDS